MCSLAHIKFTIVRSKMLLKICTSYYLRSFILSFYHRPFVLYTFYQYCSNCLEPSFLCFLYGWLLLGFQVLFLCDNPTQSKALFPYDPFPLYSHIIFSCVCLYYIANIACFQKKFSPVNILGLAQ